MSDIHTFSFQKVHRALGCEDAPPVAEENRLIVCDGLGGSGKDKLSIDENGKNMIRTSAYVGSRILSDYTDMMIKENYGALKDDVFSRPSPCSEDFWPFVNGWFSGLEGAYAKVREKLGIAPPVPGGRMLFPSTLASAVLCPFEGRLRMLIMWAGDSRVYFLGNGHGLQQLTMDDSADPYDSLHSSSHMSNCLAHQKGRNHHVNWAYHEVDEPGIVFCCSDGVTDYLPSPMTLERVLLLLGLRLKEGREGFPDAYADILSRVFFKTIYDDTTMAGAFWKMDGRTEFERTFSERIMRMAPIFEEADEMLHEDQGAPKKSGLFRRRQAGPENTARFSDIWESYVRDYQKFAELDIKRMFEDSL